MRREPVNPRVEGNISMESWQREINQVVPLAENAAKKLVVKLHERLAEI